MSHFLKEIQINKVFHLENFTIPIDEKEKKHLIITGKNGSGKTVLLNAMVNYLQKVKSDKYLDFLNLENELKKWRDVLESNKRKVKKDQNHISKVQNIIKDTKRQIQETYGKLKLEFSNIFEISQQIQKNNFLISFYEANRKIKVSPPKNPEKPNLSPAKDLKESKRDEFQKFLVDLKIQEALARNENQLPDANEIKIWFESFTSMLSVIFEDESMQLEFNYKSYTFNIVQKKKSFGFDELSDGYSAIFDIIADLILKMQDSNSLSRVYDKQGIVLIDEIETHLHLELQKAILPMLTKTFPNIQFIVTTHSPFVLNSLDNAVAFDLEKRERIEDLTQYSYEALAEGYFDVSLDSSLLQSKLNRYKELLALQKLDKAEEKELDQLETEFDSLNAATAPSNILGEYLQLQLSKK